MLESDKDTKPGEMLDSIPELAEMMRFREKVEASVVAEIRQDLGRNSPPVQFWAQSVIQMHSLQDICHVHPDKPFTNLGHLVRERNQGSKQSVGCECSTRRLVEAL